MTLTEIAETWVALAERAEGRAARAVVVTDELYEDLATEQGRPSPEVAGWRLVRPGPDDTLAGAGQAPTLSRPSPAPPCG